MITLGAFTLSDVSYTDSQNPVKSVSHLSRKSLTGIVTVRRSFVAPLLSTKRALPTEFRSG
ncbi:MAG: hypothetical protein ACLUSP_06180 [Christensenellales bacterium]